MSRLGLGLGVTAVRQRGGWTPAALPNLQLWLTADPAYCFVDAGKTTPCGHGDPVRVWADRSGHARDFGQATLAERPTLVLESGAWRVRFDGTDDFMSGGNLSAAFPAAGTVGVRVNHGGAAGVAQEYLCTEAENGYSRSSGANSYPAHLWDRRHNTQPVIPQGWGTIVTRATGTTWTRRLNGTQDSTGAGVGAFAGGTNWQIGRAGSLGTAWLNGDIVDMSCYSDYLSAGDATLLETYLTAIVA